MNKNMRDISIVLGLVCSISLPAGLIALASPDQEVKRRTAWAESKYVAYCSSQNLPFATFDTMGSRPGGEKELCHRDGEYIDFRATGSCKAGRRNLVIYETSGARLEFDHPECRSSKK